VRWIVRVHQLSVFPPPSLSLSRIIESIFTLFYCTTGCEVQQLLWYLARRFREMRNTTTSFVVSVRLSVHTDSSASTGRILMKFDIWVCLENMSRKFKFHQHLTRITDAVHVDLFTFIVSRWRSVTFSFFDTVWFICMLEIRVGTGEAAGENVLGRMRFACWITKATNKP
jgi:hypothetical protein